MRMFPVLIQFISKKKGATLRCSLVFLELIIKT